MPRSSGRVRDAVEAAAAEVPGREKDGSFLESTLRDAIARHLPGTARAEHRLQLPSWSDRLGGVDIVYEPEPGATSIGVETKVWDVRDALFDLLKLASGVQSGELEIGYSVIAALPIHWSRGGVVTAMSLPGHAGVVSTLWSTQDLLHAENQEWARIWSRASARPQALPSQLATHATAPVPMPHAPDHQIRIIGVTTAGGLQVALNDDGRPVVEAIQPGQISSPG